MARNAKRTGRENSLWVYSLLGLIVLLIIGWGIWLICGRVYFERKITLFLQEHALVAEEMEIDGFGNYVLKNIRAEGAGGGNPAIGEVRGHLPLFAGALSLKARNIRYELAPFGIFIPEAEIEQASAPEPGQGPLAGNFLLAADIKRLKIPELSVRQTGQSSAKETSYRNIECTDVRNGFIGFLSGGSIVQYAAAGPEAARPHASLVTGPFEVYDINTALWAGLYSAPGQDANSKPASRRLYGRYIIRNIVSQVFSDKEVKYHIEEISGDGLSLSAAYGKDVQEDDADPARRNPVIEISSSPADFLKAVGPLTVDIRGVTLSNLAQMNTSFDKLRFVYDGQTMNFAFDNFHVIKNGVETRLASLTLENVQFPKFLDVADELSAWSANKDTARNLDRLIRITYAVIPQFASARARGLTVSRQGQDEAVPLMGFETLTMTAEHKRGAMPTGLHLEIDKMRLPTSFFEGRGGQSADSGCKLSAPAWL